LLSSPLFAIFLVVAVDVLGLTIMIPLLPFYAEQMGASPTAVGLLIGIYAAFQMISGPLLGKWSDHVGRKPLLMFSQLGTLIAFLVTAFAPNLTILFVSRAVHGALAGNLALAQAYITDVTRPEERAKSFGLIGIAFGLGFLIGPAISGFLAEYGYRTPILTAAGMSLVSIVATQILLPSVAPGGARGSGPGGRRLALLEFGAYGGFFRRPDLASRLWQFLIFSFSFSMFIGGLPLFCERRLSWEGHPFGPAEVGYAWAFAGLLGVILQGPLLGKLVQRFSEHALNRAGFAGYVFGYAILAFTHSIPMLALSTLVTSIGGLVRPTLTSMITQAAEPEEQGVVLGLTQSLTSIAQITGPPLAGFLIEHQWLTGWGLVASAVAAGGLVLAAQRERVESPVPEGQISGGPGD
jgi:MFS family permease